ncbi:MAG TPA: hypothetical protein VLS49_09025 [Usitatibacter sp.]|nr:hypothetical protein [Usitatibacter sp.]
MKNDLEALARRIDELPVHRSKRELAKAELFAALALVQLILAASAAIRGLLSWKPIARYTSGVDESAADAQR